MHSKYSAFKVDLVVRPLCSNGSQATTVGVDKTQHPPRSKKCVHSPYSCLRVRLQHTQDGLPLALHLKVEPEDASPQCHSVIWRISLNCPFIPSFRVVLPQEKGVLPFER